MSDRARVVLADPAWLFGDKLPGKGRGASVERVLAHVTVAESGCWLWNRSKTVRGGYAQANVGGGKVVRVHKWLYEQLREPVPIGLDLDHLCRVRHCVNPAHLEPVTRAENLRRGIGNKRSATCTKGHVIAGDNIYTRPRTGRKECAQCKRQRRLG